MVEQKMPKIDKCSAEIPIIGVRPGAGPWAAFNSICWQQAFCVRHDKAALGCRADEIEFPFGAGAQ